MPDAVPFYAQLPFGSAFLGARAQRLADLLSKQGDEFFQATLAHLHSLDSNLKVGVKTTVTGVTQWGYVFFGNALDTFFCKLVVARRLLLDKIPVNDQPV